jgi:DinB superfamily
MPEVRAEMLLTWMELIDFYTLRRAMEGLTQDEFAWKPHPGAWGVVRRAECTTPSPSGAPDGEWVVDNDMDLVMAAFDQWRQGVPVNEATAFEPMTTIGWLLNHFGAAPGLAATLQFVGGPTEPTREVYGRMWAHTIIGTADEAVARFRDGWATLGAALTSATDEMLEREYEEYPRKTGFASTSALLNEVAHHGTQICVLRDLYRQLALRTAS